MTKHKQEKQNPSPTTFKVDKVNSQIERATKPVQTTVSSTYKPSTEQANANKQVEQSTQKNINTATTNADTAYKLAAKNAESNTQKANATNSMVTRQTTAQMRRSGASQSARNVASAASARSASTIASARSNAIKTAQATRKKTISSAKVSAYGTRAKLQSANLQKDVARSTQQNKMTAQENAQSKEAQKGRNLKNAIWRKNNKITLHEEKLQKQEKRHERQQRKIAVYSQTLPNRYTSVKSVDKAIKKMKKKKGSSASQKLGYLQALRAALLKKKAEEKQQKSGSGRRGSGGRRSYGRRGYGSSGSNSSNGNSPVLPSKNGSKSGKSKATGKVDFNMTRAYQYAAGKKSGANGVERMWAQGQRNAMHIQKDSKKIAKNHAKWKNKGTNASSSKGFRGKSSYKSVTSRFKK